MKASILLADAARAHGDGTFSVLRGGVDVLNVPLGEPIVFRGSAVIRVLGSIGEQGDHVFKVRFVNEDGQSISPDIAGGFAIPSAGGTALIVFDFQLFLPRYGRYSFTIAVDSHQLDDLVVTAKEADAKQSGANPKGPNR